jgi:Flavin containing amine oxidoreductase
MVRHVKTVPTQAFQIWMRKDVHELGWPHPPTNLSGFVEPFDTWADMSHLIPEESWSDPVKAIGYFCSVLPDAAPEGDVTERFHAEQHEQVRRKATSGRGGFRWDVLASEDGGRRPQGSDTERSFDTQYWTANVNPTDRYVLSLPGSIGYRLSPLDMTFDNLTIAGDWTATGLDTGCIESAVMSGRLAAHAISRQPALEDIVGYDHP